MASKKRPYLWTTPAGTCPGADQVRRYRGISAFRQVLILGHTL